MSADGGRTPQAPGLRLTLGTLAVVLGLTLIVLLALILLRACGPAPSPAPGTGTPPAPSTPGTPSIPFPTTPTSVIRPDAPFLLLPADISVEASSAAGASAAFQPQGTDAKGDPVPVTCQPASGAAFPIGTTRVECTVRSSTGAVTKGSFAVKVQHTVPPTLTVPSDIKAEAVNASGAPVSYSVSVTDPVDKASYTCDHPSDAIFPLGDTKVTCTARDERNNERKASFKVSVVDTTSPQITAPPDITEEAAGPSGATASFTPQATDTAGQVTVACTPKTGSMFPIGTTSVSCTATDASKNASKASFKVNVVDTTPPQVKVPADMVAEATGPNGAIVKYSVSATDSAGKATVDCGSHNSGSLFPFGPTTVTCTGKDAHGNTNSADFKVIVSDTTPPKITIPTDVQAEATSASGAFVTYPLTVTDAVDKPSVDCGTHVSGSLFPIGSTPVTCNASDSRGNRSSAGFTVTVVHTLQKPKVPADMTVEANVRDGRVVTYTVSIVDPVDPPASVDCGEHKSGSLFLVGPTLVTCIGTDSYHNTSQATFTVTVTHTLAKPKVPDDMMVIAPSSEGVEVPFEVPIFDPVDDAWVECSPSSGSHFDVGETTVTCTGHDTLKRTSSASFKVTVVYYAPELNFVNEGFAATWTNEVGDRVAAPGDPLDRRGSVTMSEQTLLTHPAFGPNRAIQGVYTPSLTIRPGDRLRLKVGIIGSAGRGQVTFHVATRDKEIRSLRESDFNREIEVDLSPYAGYDGPFILTVTSDGDASGAWPTWIIARIERPYLSVP